MNLIVAPLPAFSAIFTAPPSLIVLRNMPKLSGYENVYFDRVLIHVDVVKPHTIKQCPLLTNYLGWSCQDGSYVMTSQYVRRSLNVSPSLGRQEAGFHNCQSLLIVSPADISCHNSTTAPIAGPRDSQGGLELIKAYLCCPCA